MSLRFGVIGTRGLLKRKADRWVYYLMSCSLSFFEGLTISNAEFGMTTCSPTAWVRPRRTKPSCSPCSQQPMRKLIIGLVHAQENRTEADVPCTRRAPGAVWWSEILIGFATPRPTRRNFSIGASVFRLVFWPPHRCREVLFVWCSSFQSRT